MINYGIKSLLVNEGIISDEKILDEIRFDNFLSALFLYYFSYERYRYFFNKTVNETISSISKGKKYSFSPLLCPFRFVGIENKTLFIAKMSQAHLFFKETLTPFFFNSFSILTHGKLILEDRTNPLIWKRHECLSICEQCKRDFSAFASQNLQSLCKGLEINSYILLDINAEIFKGLISADEFIEVEQQIPRCSCNERLFRHHKYCSNCGLKVDKELFTKDETIGNPEKIFNEALAVYLSLKNGYNYKANHTEDELFNEETDILLFKEEKVKIIEGTVKMDLDKSYIIGKTKTLVLIEKLLKKDDFADRDKRLVCDVIVWSINQPSNVEELEQVSKRIFPDGERIKIISSNVFLEENNRLEIDMAYLNNIKIGFKNILDSIVKNI